MKANIYPSSYRVIYERGRLKVAVRISDDSPTTVTVAAFSDHGMARTELRWAFFCVDATTEPIKRWQFWRICLEDAIEEARAMVDLRAGQRWFSIEQIERKMEELRLREKAIQELEQESLLRIA